MNVELAEIRDFLAAQHPFDALPDAVLDGLPAQLSVRYLRRGTPFPPPDADARYVYVVRQGALELRDRRGELLDKLGEGDLSSMACSDDGPESAMTGVAAEDTLLYLLPCTGLDALRREHPDFGRHFDAALAGRLRRAIDLLQAAPPGGTSLLGVTAGALVGRAPVFVAPQVSIRDAAARMTRERVSSLLVMEGDALVGLVTDRDLRSRCLAAGVDAGDPVRSIMTADVHTADAATPGFELLLRMTRENVHHLPVVDGERVLGMVSTTDLIRHEGANTVYLAGDANKAESVAALAAVAAAALRTDATATHAALVVAVTTLGAGGACALAAVFVPAFARLFLRAARSELEVRQYAQALFLERELFRTRGRCGILLLVSLFERRVELLPDTGFGDRIAPADWAGVVARMTPQLAQRRPAAALLEGVAALAELLERRGYRAAPDDRNELPDRPIESRGE